MLYTDGLIEATLAEGPQADAPPVGGTPGRRERLGVQGLVAAVDTELAHGGEGLVERLFRRVRTLHGGPLADDAAVLVIGWGGPDQDARGERTATLADSDGWSQ